ncbi:MAG: T9SS type A sorting domain-containing protein [Ignavibacteriales bacterium]|nr:T9SS type A sorting domain-containing protein [Ignavibacteriales bacterium]
MKLKATFFSILLILTIQSNFAQESLQVIDPQSWWSSDWGTIEEATLTVKPHGIYMEYGFTVSFSARNSYFSESDVLEVELLFDMPPGTIINDLWLWIGEDIMKAQIMDQWTASSIYEEIVDRRKDPALLIKRGKQNYELRIYPMLGGEQRKVRINYLVPAKWLSNSVTAELPMNVINLSRNKLDKLDVIYFPKNEWAEPKINELPNQTFSVNQDSSFQTFYKTEIASDNLLNSLNLSVPSPMKNGIYVNKYNLENEGVYQLAFLPSSQLTDSTSKKVALLLDYKQNKSTLSLQDILLNIKSLLNDHFTEVDSFNIIYSKLEIKKASENWLGADSSTIEQVLSAIISDSISFYSNLPSLLNEGINFINENGHNGEILLIANSDEIGEVEIANQLINDLQKIMTPIFPIHIADLNNINYYYNWIGGRNYIGNEYLYLNLARITRSNYQNLREKNSISEILTSILQSLSGTITSFDLHTTLENGFCFGRFNTNLNETIYRTSPIVQIGKYMGSFPLKIEVSGVYNSQVFSRTTSISEEDIFESDSLSNVIWNGKYISSLETGYESNEEINNIINLSVDNRILSLYTAFIAIEPGDSSEFCYDCSDDNDLIISVDDKDKFEIADSLFIQAYPNPFNPTTTLNVNLPKDVDFNSLNMKIFNILGEEVMSFNASQYFDKRNFQLKWNGTNNYGESVSTGIYFFVLSTKDIRQTVKLMMMK